MTDDRAEMKANRDAGLVKRHEQRLARAQEVLTIRIPRADWDQIVSDIENMCGRSSDDIEILQSVQIVKATL